MRDRLWSVSPAIMLGLLFGWLLGLPFFGPWLVHSAPTNATILALAFALGHIIGFTGCGFSRLPIPPRFRFLAAVSLSVGTTAHFVLTLSPVASGVVFFVMGILAAALIADWTTWFARCAEPHLSMATAMVGSNILLALFLIPGLPPALAKLTLVVLPLLVAFIQPVYLVREEYTYPPVDGASVRKSVWALGAFAVIAYFIGGVWYRLYAVPSFSSNVSFAMFDVGCYILGLLGLAWWLRARKSLAPIATVTLSILGLAIVLAQVTSSITPRILLSLGLAGTDYYFWLALWALSQYLPARWVFSLGLGFSLIQIIMATLFDMYGIPQGYSREAFFLVATGITMLLLPLVFSSRFHLTSPERERGILSPNSLTETESKVYSLLTQGFGDQNIASELHISRHTVKFHVRNILHKCDVPNRKVLLSRLAGKV